MTLLVLFLLCPLFFALLGSIPTGYLIGQAHHIDIRQQGSGNIGATNVGRVLGRKWGILAFLCDFLKGFLFLFLLHYFLPYGSPRVEAALVLCAIAAILGHNYTPWLGFKGGKGIATSAGVLGALVPWTLLIAFSGWALAVLLTRYVSVGSILASLLLAPVTWFFYPGQWIFLALATVAGILGIWRHRGNIARLRAGTEAKIGSGKKA